MQQLWNNIEGKYCRIRLVPFSPPGLPLYRDIKNSAVCVRTRTVNVNTFSATVKDEILEGR